MECDKIVKMCEISELRQLVAQLMRELQTQSDVYQKLIADLIGELARVYAPPRDNGVVVTAAATMTAAGAAATKGQPPIPAKRTMLPSNDVKLEDGVLDDKICEMSLAVREGHRMKNLSETSECDEMSESSQSGSSRPHSERSSDESVGSDESSYGGPRWCVKRNRRRLGHYARECRDGTSVEAVEVGNGQDEEIVVLPWTSLQMEKFKNGTWDSHSDPGERKSFSHGTNGRRAGRCWKCRKFGHHRAQCWTRSPQKQPGYVGRGPHRKQSTTGLTDSIDYGVLAKYVVAAMHDVEASQGSMLQSPQQRDGFIGGKRPQLQMDFKSSRWRRSLQV